jgi:hypothetical protein
MSASADPVHVAPRLGAWALFGGLIAAAGLPI